MGSITNVYLITGFLGSGKTTFLNRIVAEFPRDRKLMILMNEFGEVGVDGALVEGTDIDMLEISKGSIFCVCVKTDFIKGLNEIAQKIQPDVLLMESTGVANPTDLKRDLALPFFKGRFILAEQFCLVDALNFADEYEVFASVEKQIASSTRFIINKTDLADREQIDAVKALIALHHPDPAFYETTYAQVPLDRFLPEFRPRGDEPEAAPEPAGLSETDLEEAIEALLDDPCREVTPPDRLLSAVYVWRGESLAEFRDAMRRLPKAIVRAKGFIRADGGVHLFSRVLSRETITPAVLAENRQNLLNRLVFIAPPEAIAELEEIVSESSILTRQSVFDPMAGQD